MKRLTILFLFLVSLFLLNACGGSKELAKTDTGDIPEWYLNTPTGANYIFEAASSTSRDMDLAINKASTEARAKIARSLEVKVNSMQKKFEEEVGQGENSEFLSQFTQATKTVVSSELRGSQITEKKLVKDGNNWRAYVLAKYPIGAAQKAFLNKITNNQNLYTRVRATEAFNELEKDVYKYDNPNQTKVVKETVPQISNVEKAVSAPVAAITTTKAIETASNLTVDLNEYTFELVNCQLKNRKVTCSLIINNNSENDVNLRLSLRETKIFDESGNEYPVTTIKLANSSSKKGWSIIEKQIVPNIATPAKFIFENVSSKTNKISLFSFYVMDGGHEVKFRNVPLEIVN